MGNKITYPSNKVEKRAFWADHIRKLIASGETKKVYCQAHKRKIQQLICKRKLNRTLAEIE